MPVYEYHCNTCGETFEKLVRFSEVDKLPECPECHSPNTNKRISLLARSSFAGVSGGQSTSSCSAPAGRSFG